MSRALTGPAFRRRTISLTSLIDVIFLLLLFFMLTSTFTRFSEIELMAAPGTAGRSADQPPVFVRLDAEGTSVNGVERTLGNLVVTLAEQLAPDQTVLLSVVDGVDAQRFVDVLTELKRGIANPIVVIGG